MLQRGNVLVMAKVKKECKYCGLEYDSYDDVESLLSHGAGECKECKTINEINEFFHKYSNNHSSKVWSNKIHERNMIKDNILYSSGVTSYTLAKHKTSYRVEKRTNRVQAIIDKISYIRDYLYFSLNPIFEILDSIYIKKDCFWDETGNLIRYVHNCCFQEALLKLREILLDGSCKYSIKRISNSLLADSKYVFKEQKIYERLEFEDSKDVIEESFEPFSIENFVKLIEKVLDENEGILDAIKDYRDNQIAHINELKNPDSPKMLSYVNLKRMFSLAKCIYDGFLYVTAPDKYASIIFDSNIWFSHLNEICKDSKKYREEQREKREKPLKR